MTSTSGGTPGRASPLSVQEAADLLGLHYMTVYRHVRIGQLPARKVGNQWQLDRRDVEAVLRQRAPQDHAPEVADLAHLLEAALTDADEARAWDLLSDAARSGLSPDATYLDVLGPAMRGIGERWAAGELTIAQEHKASAVVTRLVGRLGHRFSNRGRRRGRVVIGSAEGDQHGLPAAMFADLLRQRGLEVVDLGAGNPVGSFLRALERADGPAAACVTVTTVGNDDAVRRLVRGIVDRFPHVPVAVGGSAVTGEEHARSLGSALWEPDPRRAAARVAELVSPPGSSPAPAGG